MLGAWAFAPGSLIRSGSALSQLHDNNYNCISPRHYLYNAHDLHASRAQSSPRPSPSSPTRLLASPPWASAVSLCDNLDLAIAEALLAAHPPSAPPTAFDVAIFFVSSIYEASAYRYSSVFDAIRAAHPSIKHIVGCTTGAVIGPLSPLTEPLEAEARSSISVTLAKLDPDVSAGCIAMTPEQVGAFIKGGKSPFAGLAPPPAAANDGGSSSGKVLFLLATDGLKNKLAELVTCLRERDGATAFGAVASSVTSLHTPKVFAASIDLDGNGAAMSDMLKVCPPSHN